MDDKKNTDLTTEKSLDAPSIDSVNATNPNPDKKDYQRKKKKTNAIIATVLSTIVCVLLFIDGFFSYNFSSYLIWLTSDKYYGSFSYLLNDSKVGLFLFPSIIIIASFIIIVFSWINVRRTRGIKTICAGLAIICLVIGTFVGKSTFFFYSRDYLPSLDTYSTVLKEYNSISFLFFIIIALQLLLLVICFLEDLKNNKTSFKTRKEVMTEHQATASTGNPTVLQVPSPADEIKKYKELLDSGIISQEEYDSKRNQLLGL